MLVLLGDTTVSVLERATEPYVGWVPQEGLSSTAIVERLRRRLRCTGYRAHLTLEVNPVGPDSKDLDETEVGWFSEHSVISNEEDEVRNSTGGGARLMCMEHLAAVRSPKSRSIQLWSPPAI